MATIPQSPGVRKPGRVGNGKLKPTAKPKLVQLGPSYVAKATKRRTRP